HPGTMLHDGAVIVRGDRIVAAGCLLPLTDSPAVSTAIHTRHRAAMGVSERSDAVAVVVSEETGAVSLSLEGKLLRGLKEETLRGPMELLQGVQSSSITAQVNLRGNRVLTAQVLPVQVEIPRDLRERNVIAIADWTPKSVKVRLDEIITRYLQVTPRLDAEPP